MRRGKKAEPEKNKEKGKKETIVLVGIARWRCTKEIPDLVGRARQMCTQETTALVGIARRVCIGAGKLLT
jgi:hypothetical protein